MDQLTVVFVEAVCWGYEHAAYNASIIRCAKTLGATALIAEPGHLAAVKKGGGIESTVWIEGTPPTRTLRGRHRGPAYRRLLESVSRTCTELNAHHVVFTCADTTLLHELAWWSRRQRNLVTVAAILHSELQQLSSPYGRNPMRRLEGAPFALHRACRGGVTPIIIDSAIASQLPMAKRKLSESVNSALAIVPHPLPTFDQSRAKPSGSRRVPNIPRIGFLGLGSIRKGLRNYVELVELASSQYPGTMEFSMIGSVANDQGGRDMAHRLREQGVQADVKPISQKEYTNGLLALDAVVLPYDCAAYEFVVSGALLDAIAGRVPIISTPFTQAKALLDRYRIGTLVEQDNFASSALDQVQSKAIWTSTSQDEFSKVQELYGDAEVSASLRSALGFAEPTARHTRASG